MSDKKSWGSTVLGWFVVQEPGEGASPDATPEAGYRPFQDVKLPGHESKATPTSAESDEDIIKRTAAGTQAAPPLPVFNTPPPAATGGIVEFEQVFEAAGIDAAERERVTRTLDLLNSLPPGTDEATKKQIVTASLRAFNIPVEKIIEAGAQELQALEAYIRTGAAGLEKMTAEADQRIKQFEEEIVKLRTVMQQRVDEQNGTVHGCNAKKLEVQKVLEFFGQEAVAKVVRDSPKLQEPSS